VAKYLLPQEELQLSLRYFQISSPSPSLSDTADKQISKSPNHEMRTFVTELNFSN